VSSCVPEAEDVFELSALERADKNKEECFNALIDAEKGWLVEYYPLVKHYGGYTFIMNFTDEGRVEMTPEVAFEENATNSTFRVHSGQGTVLSFDTYGALHHLADPEELLPKYKNQDISWADLRENPYVSFGTGYGGDFEFTLDSIGEEQIYFTSLKRKTRVVFTKIKDTSGKAYLQAQSNINTILEEKASDGLFVEYNGKQLELTYDFFHKFNIYQHDSIGVYAEEPMPFVVTDTGIKLYEALTIDNVTVSEFDWIEGEGIFRSEEGAMLVQGRTPRSEFTSPTDYAIHWVNFKLSSQAFLDDVKILEAEMYNASPNPGLFGGVKDIRFIMNGYSTYQAYFGGSHRIDIYSEIAAVRESNLYLIGTTAISMTETAFNFALSFGDGAGGTAGYAPFHSLVDNWLYKVLYQPNVFNVEVEERWSLGERYTNIKLIRKDNPDYYIILELQEN